MRYDLRFEVRAQDNVRDLSAELLPYLWPQLERLRESPVTLSMPGAPPASLPNRQIFAFPVNMPDGREFTFRVHYRYGQDEQTLWILSITAIQHS